MHLSLTRFIEAQEHSYQQALAEIQVGRKTSHWMWYIFPQIKGLGFSQLSKYYAIQNIQEAQDFLTHPILGQRLREISKTLLAIEEQEANAIFGSPDDLKLQSSMTLFAIADVSADNLFQKVLDKFFNGNFDDKTLEKLQT